jgi:Arc/MetJ-type ribon-helix-helix transcriptional regulator
MVGRLVGMASAKKQDEKPPSAPRKRGRPKKSTNPPVEAAAPPEADPKVGQNVLEHQELPVDNTPIAQPQSYNMMAPSPANKQWDQRRSCTITLRAPMQLVDDVDYWVNNRSYKSRSEFILASMRYYLDYLEYRESFNVRTFQRGQTGDIPSERFDRLRYLRGNP